jgi:6-phosphogluconolactonase (cycloisomerase 2 family)
MYMYVSEGLVYRVDFYASRGTVINFDEVQSFEKAEYDFQYQGWCLMIRRAADQRSGFKLCVADRTSK